MTDRNTRQSSGILTNEPIKYMKKLLATATPNVSYVHYSNFIGLTIQAVLINDQVRYYEVHADNIEWRVPLKEELVKKLFFANTIIKHQPFLLKENKQFTIVLLRHRRRYTEQFEIMKTSSTKSKFKRTK
jgi:archaellum biogenesis ATPase FlaH